MPAPRPWTAAALSLLLSFPLVAQTVYPRGTTIWSKDETWNGLTLFPNAIGEGILINMAGTVVNRWTSPISGHVLTLVEPVGNGHILCGSRLPGANLNVQTLLELDWAGNIVWSFTLPIAEGYIHHDFERLPNGNTLVLCAQRVVVPSISPMVLVDDFIIEVTPAGNVVWRWETWRNFKQFGFSAQAQQLISARGSDWAHTNTLNALPPNRHRNPAFRAGNLVLSQAFTNTMFIVDRETGNIVWQAGPNNSLTRGQHAPYMIGPELPGAGNLLVFDNGNGAGYPVNGRPPCFSRVIEIDPSNNSLPWTYTAVRSGLNNRSFFSDIVSNAERLPNGNTLICSGVRGRLFEITRSGQIVWEYMSPFSLTFSQVYRARRVPLGWGQ